MSDPGAIVADPNPEPTLVEQTGNIPETVVPVEETPEPAEETPAAAEAKPETIPEPVKPKRTPWYQDRINQLTAQKTQERTAREAAEARLAALEKKPEGEQPPTFKPEQFEQLIDQRAQALDAQRQAERSGRAFIEAGNKEFGPTEFMEKCNEVAALGAGESREFMALVTDPDVLPEGHKVIAALADHPEEAQRILALNPLKMASALTRFATTMKTPEKQISNAPAPIKPVGGTAKPSAPADNEPMAVWLQKRNATARTTAGGKPNR